MARKLDTRQVADAVIDQNTKTATASKKKRKRKEKEPTTSHAVDDAHHHSPEGAEHRKKKKKKTHVAKHTSQEPASTAGSRDQHVANGDAAGTSAITSQSEKKKKKKDKQRERRVEQPLDPHIDPSLTAMDAGPSTNAVISAVIAAATSSSAQGHPQPTSLVQQASSFHPSSFQHLPPGLAGPPLSFSGEDLARALQGLDVAKLADALHALGEAGSNTFPLPGQSVPSQPPAGSHQHPPPPQPAYSQDAPTQMVVPVGSGAGNAAQGQVPVPSATILGQPPGNPEHHSVPQSVPPVSTPISLREDHAHLLASKWLSATKLNELTKTIGLQYKKGKFSASEEALLRNAIENYRVRNGLSHDQLNELIFAKGVKDKDNALWFEITSYLPSRPVVAVYHHVRRAFHPLKQQGKWMPAEDEALRQAVAEFGQSWEKVSQHVGRMAGDCRDRWRNYVNNREGRAQGAWSKEEEDRLTQIVTEMTTAQGKNPDLDVFWTQVAARMGTRGRQQCRIKWTDCLSKTVKNAGQRPRWSQQDAYILVHKIASLNVNDDSEIDWKLLGDENWNLWSTHTLQRRWLTLKRSVRGHEEMAHQEIMDILCSKKAHPPPLPSAPAKRRVTSAAIVPADAQASDVAIEDTHVAGPSDCGDVHDAPFAGHTVGAGQPTQPHFNGYVASVPHVGPNQTTTNDGGGLGPSNTQHSDDDPSSSSDSDASDSD